MQWQTAHIAISDICQSKTEKNMDMLHSFGEFVQFFSLKKTTFTLQQVIAFTVIIFVFQIRCEHRVPQMWQMFRP